MPEGTEARGRSGLAATGAGEGLAADLPGPGGGAALTGAAIETEGCVAGAACD